MTPAERDLLTAIGDGKALTENQRIFLRTLSAEPDKALNDRDRAYLARIAGKAGVPVPEGFLKLQADRQSAVLPPRLPFHPYADLFPLIDGHDFEELVEDIRENGLQDEIELLDGAVLDGRNRYLALRAIAERGLVLGAGWKPLDGKPLPARSLDPEESGEMVDFDSHAHGEPLAYVLSKNLHRRHLTDDQRRLVAASLVTMGRGRPAGENAANSGISRAEAAHRLGTDEAGVERARAIVTHGVADLQDAVRQGRASVSAAAEIARLPQEDQKRVLDDIARQPETRRAFMATVKEIRRERQEEKRDHRQEREAKLGARQQALPQKRYGVILVDDEWDFEVRSRETGMDRHAANHYPVSETAHTAEEIHERTKERFACAAEDSVCAMWSTVPHLAIALRLMELRGYRYVTNFNWSKDRVGTGYWNRNKHEHLLVGVRGNVPAPAMGTQFDSDLPAPVRGHSVKPDWQYDLLEAYFPSLPKIELNARRARPGWDAWGNEAPESDGEGAGVTPREDGVSEEVAPLPSSPSEPFDPETGEIIEGDPLPSSPLQGEGEQAAAPDRNNPPSEGGGGIVESPSAADLTIPKDLWVAPEPWPGRDDSEAA